MKPLLREAAVFAAPSVPLVLLALAVSLLGSGRLKARELFPARADTWANPGMRLLGASDDVTGDGRADIVLFDFNTSNVAVVSLRGRAIQAPSYWGLPGGTASAAATLAQVDPDQSFDVVQLGKRAKGRTRATLTVRPGTRPGFSTKPVLVAGDLANPDLLTDVAVGCLDGDELPDLLVGARGAPFTAYLARRDGTWEAKEVPLGHASAFVLADLDQDGINDIVADSGNGGVTVHHGNGDATFSSPVTTQVPGHITRIVARRVDRDELIDLVVLSSSGVSVLRNMNARTFRAVPAATLQASSLAVLDVDRDGLADIVTAGSARELNVLLQEPAGTFEAPRRVPTRDTPWGLVAGDVDGDGHEEVVTVAPSGNVTVLFGR